MYMIFCVKDDIDPGVQNVKSRVYSAPGASGKSSREVCRVGQGRLAILQCCVQGVQCYLTSKNQNKVFSTLDSENPLTFDL